MNTLIIACRTIADELNMIIKETNCNFPILWIDSGLHNHPELLRERLQQELNHISNVDQILLAFGYCGNALLGITAPNCKLIFPRVDDCITLLLGSCQKRKEISDEMGTYFLTKGWLDYETNIWVEYQDAVKKYGKSRADRIFKAMLQHYKRLAIVETGAYSLDAFIEKTKEIAENLKLTHQVIPGELRYMRKLLTGPWDSEFIVINPGETIAISHIHEDTLQSAKTL